MLSLKFYYTKQLLKQKVEIDYPSVMLWNTLCARLHGTIHNYFISNMGETKNRELNVFPDFSLFHSLFSKGEHSMVHGFIAPVYIFFKRIGWRVYWPFNMAEWEVVAVILLDVVVDQNMWCMIKRRSQYYIFSIFF